MKSRMPWLAAAVVFLVHLIGNAHYGFFRDELYFIICGRHPQWGYVDQPPVVPLLAALTQMFGHSLFLLRLVPALFAAGGAYVTCLLVVEFGGGIFAQALATLVFLFSAVLMNFGMKVSPDEVGLLTWPLLAYLLVRLVKGADPRLWLLAGAVAGISIESKYSVIFFLVAILAGLALTPQRSILGSKWFAYGGAIALAIALPNFLWQAHYGFPMWELLRAGQNGKNIVVGPLVYLFQEILITNLFLFPVWVIGLMWLLRTTAHRFLGYAYIILIAEMIVLHGKHYYPADVYPILIAGGGVAIESWTKSGRIARVAIVAYTLALGWVFVPFALPILPERTFIAYQAQLGALLHLSKSATATEHGRDSSTLPGDWADMHGWPELAATVQSIYDSLPANERAQAVAITSNYGEAAAIEFFAPGVPVISHHNQYWLWGTRGFSGNVLIDVHGDCGAGMHVFKSAHLATRFNAPYTIGDETDIPIMICRGIKAPLSTYWPMLKEYE
ncbi:MAG TPA: glycosyltransferase family 39 protein [Candidatus Baltobacteraceae bacterium]|nr:glycosyltransferase family 39 protein [Candidatus Baltobacteraceae bacterium]